MPDSKPSQVQTESGPELFPVAPEMTQFLSHRIARLHLLLNAQAGALLDQSGSLGLGQWRIIALIGSGAASTSRDIARKSVLDPAFISRTLRSLEAEGFVVTERSESDRRVLHVELTEKGREYSDRSLPRFLARQKALANALDEEEQSALVKILDKLEAVARRRDIEP